MRRLIALSALVLGVGSAVHAQVSSDLAQLVESRQELNLDYNILLTRQRNTRTEYSFGNFCTPQGLVGLTPAAQKARQTYCAQKTTELNSKDADLRAQLQKLALAVKQLDGRIAEAQRTASPPKPR
jgi:hypothetical protein